MSTGSMSPCNSKSSSKKTSLWVRCFRNFIGNWFAVMRISQVENWESSRKSARFWKAFNRASWTAFSESPLLRVTV